MLSVTCKASIKAVIYLGSKSHLDEKASIKEVAEFINENEHTVGKLLQKLVKEELINSAKGPNGGFFISENQVHLPVIKVIESIDGMRVFKECGLGLDHCSDDRPCPMHEYFKPIRDMFTQMCSKKKIIDMYEPVNNGLVYLLG